MAQNISEGRKAAYYVGIAISIIGGLLFASVFVSAAMNFGDFHNFEGKTKSMMFRAFGEMAMIILGAVISNIGARGLAGSGAVLDPQKAREDLEPYTRMAGGMIKDALDETGVSLGKSQPEKVIVVKCPKCGKLNEEDSKFCQECGGKL